MSVNQQLLSLSFLFSSLLLSSNFTSRSDGRIARHYKWSIEAAFHRFNSPGGIKGWIFLRGKTEIGKIFACLQWFVLLVLTCFDLTCNEVLQHCFTSICNKVESWIHT